MGKRVLVTGELGFIGSHFLKKSNEFEVVPGQCDVLNWKEVDALVKTVRPEIEGLFVDRIIIPERPKLPGGFLRGEWTMRLTGRKSEAAIFVCVRARQPYLAFAPGRGPKAATSSTHSPDASSPFGLGKISLIITSAGKSDSPALEVAKTPALIAITVE